MILPARLFTIGFTHTSAEHFFGRLRSAGVRRVVDVRLSNVSQLAGFAKRADLEWFLRTIGSVEYVHAAALAPTHELLGAWRRREIDWNEYELRFRALMEQRSVEDLFARSDLESAALLCSESSAEKCHRRLVAEHFEHAWAGLVIVHL